MRAATGALMKYCGWNILDCRGSSIATAQWRAERFGVWMSANTRELLYTMIDLRAAEGDRFQSSPLPQ